MGTDIHSFVEVSYSKESPIFYCIGHFGLDRDYNLFNVLGNGRNYGFPRSEWKLEAFIEPRGAPRDISLWAARELYDLILGSSEPFQGEIPDHWFWNPDDCLSLADAENRIKKNESFKSFKGEVRQTFHLQEHWKYEYATWKTVSKIGFHSPRKLEPRK